MTKYLVVYEQGERGWGAHSPDLPGCYAFGSTREEVERRMSEAVAFHVEGLRGGGQQVPEPVHSAGYVAA